MSATALLQAQGLCKAFGGVQAVRSLSLSVEPGQMLALMGPNGAGKSTTFNLLNGQLKPDAGCVFINGQQVQPHTPRQLWQLGVGRTFQVAQTFAWMPALTQVQLALQARQRRQTWQWLKGWWRPLGNDYQEQAMFWLSQLQLDQDALSCPADRPYGWVKRLELALCLCQQPRVLLMDEPTAGLTPQERQQLMRLTRSLVNEHQLAVVFTEHSLDAVFGFADYMVLLHQGQQVAQGRPEQVQAMPEAKALYFGAGS